MPAPQCALQLITSDGQKHIFKVRYNQYFWGRYHDTDIDAEKHFLVRITWPFITIHLFQI